MAVSTANTILKNCATETGTYTKLVDIVSYPDMGGEPSTIDTTDLTATKTKTNVIGLQELDKFTFECNYDKTAYTTIAAMASTKSWFQLEFGEDGVDGIFRWQGTPSIFITGGGVDEARKMTLSISGETEVEMVTVTP